MLAVGGLPVFNVVVVKFYINCMVAINRCMIVLVLILIYTSLTVNYSYLRIIRLTSNLTMRVTDLTVLKVVDSDGNRVGDTSRNRWFDEPAEGECSSSTWYIIRFDIRNGIRKCMVKNLLNVASPTMNPPHSHLPIGCPTTKITLTKFVITVAAQKLICPQGNTYPTKAVRKVKRNTTTPVSQTLSYRSETY